MAQKKGFLYRVMMGKDDQADFDVAKLPSTRWQVFKDVFKNRLGALTKINLLTVLFCLPAIAWLIYCILSSALTNASVNYTGNLGFGLSPTSSAVAMGNALGLQLTLLEFAVFIPLFMIASIGFAGAFHTYKMLIWGEGIAVASTFMKGIKNNIVTFLWTSLLLSAGLLLVMFNVSSLSIQPNQAMAILALVASCILMVILIFMAMFMWTQSVTYKMDVWTLIKNSFIFSIGMLLQNIFFVALSLVPLILILFTPFTIALMIAILFLLFGFSYMFMIWTVYAHYCFDKYLNDQTPGAIKNRGMYTISKEEAEQRRAEAAERRRKANNVRYVNPKKGKRPEKAEITPLEPTFSRKELQRLEEEKKSLAKAAEVEDVEATIEPAESADADQGAED